MWTAWISLSVVFLAATLASIGLLTGISQVWQPAGNPVGQPAQPAVGVLLPSDQGNFWKQFASTLVKKGQTAGLNIVLDWYQQNQAYGPLDRLSLSDLQALVVYPPETEVILPLLARCRERGLPVALLETDLPHSARTLFLGSNAYQQGLALGKRLRDSVRTPQHGLVLRSQSTSGQSLRTSLFMTGLRKALEGHPGSQIDLDEAGLPPGRFAGEESVWSLLRQPSPPNFLITLNADATLSALTAIVEANRVGKTSLLGVGEDAQLLEASRQGLLTGLLYRDADTWARTLLLTVKNLLAGPPDTVYVNLPVDLLPDTEARFGGR